MQTKTKRLATVAVAFSSLALALGVITFGGKDALFNKSNAEDAGLIVSGSNGAAAAATLKTSTVSATTALGNAIKFDYKNMVVVSGKVGTVKAKGFYGNREPIYQMTKIVVESDAVPGDAVLKYGKTSACIDGQVDLATGEVAGIDANYFKVVARNDVTIDTIKATYGCDNTDTGFVAVSGETDKKSDYRFVKNSANGYDFSQKTSTAYHYAKKLVIPDYYHGGDGYLPVTRLMNNSSYGLFERADSIEEVYFPETITEFGTYFWSGTHNAITQFTYPRDLTTTSSTGGFVPVSTGLKTIYYNSKNMTYTGSNGVKKGNQPNLESIYVSYDVEKLANNFMPSSKTDVPTNLTVYYEGTTAEWNTLVETASNWNIDNIICSDTTISTVAFHYANSTLNGDASGLYEVGKAVGKTVNDPGNPVWTGEGSKVFDGWYTAAVGGDKVIFPYTVAGDVDLYAQFVDMPSGYSLNDPTPVALGGTYTLETRADLGYIYYVSYTATKEETIIFNATGNVSSKSKNDKFRVFDTDGTRLDGNSYSNSASESIKDVALFTSDDPTVAKVHFEAGQTRIIAWSSYDFTNGYYGKTTLTLTDAATTHQDYRYAEPYTVGTEASVTGIPEDGPYFQSFTVETNGTYTVTFNTQGAPACASEIGYIEGGSWKSLASGTNQKSSKFVALNAGVTYYIASRAYSYNAASVYHYSVVAGTPAGYEAANAIEVSTNGTEFNNTNPGSYYWNYYKFTVTEEGYYKLDCSTNVYAQDYSYSSTNSSQYVQVSSNADMTGVLDGYRTFDNTGSSYSKSLYYYLEAGTYYMKASVNSTPNKFSISAVAAADMEGAITATAKEITLTDGVAINTSSAGENGSLFKFTVTSGNWHVFTAESTAVVKIGSQSKSSNAYYFSTTYSMSNGDLHKKLTVGNTYYMYVKGTASINFSLAESIQDGESRDTAWTYVLGTEEKTVSNGGRVKSTTTYFNFAVTETGSYLVNRGTTSSFNFKLYDGDSQVSVASTNDKIAQYNLTAGKTYRIEAYSYGFSITKAQPGFAKSDSIEITIGAEQTAVTFNCVFGSAGTWYKFVAESAGWYEFATTASGASADIYVGTSTTKAATASANAGDVKLAVGDVVYICAKGTAGASTEYTIAHPTSVQNGLTPETAWTYQYDAGQDYMTVTYEKTVHTDSNGYFYMAIELPANTSFVCYSVSNSDWDGDSVYFGTSTTALTNDKKDIDISSSDTDTIAGTPYKIQEKTGSTNSNDFYFRFTTGEAGTYFLKLREYTSSTNTAKIYVKTTESFLNPSTEEDPTPETPVGECTFDFAAIESGAWYDADYEYALDASAANRTISICDGKSFSTVYRTYTYVSENNGVYTFAYNSETITVQFSDSGTLRIIGGSYAGTYYNY